MNQSGRAPIAFWPLAACTLVFIMVVAVGKHQATPEYRHVDKGMSLDQLKSILRAVPWSCHELRTA